MTSEEQNNRAAFDDIAQTYAVQHAASIKFSGESTEYFAVYKIRDVQIEFEAHRIGGRRQVQILDFGAGIGNSIPFFRKYFPTAHLVSADVSGQSLAIAKSRYPDSCEFCNVKKSSELPFDAERFDIIFVSCVFHHIHEQHHLENLRELRRVLHPEGRLFIFEHNPYNPLTLRAVRNCEFDADAVLITGRRMCTRIIDAGFSAAELKYTLFFPKFLERFRPLERFLTKVPIGAQYYVVGNK